MQGRPAEDLHVVGPLAEHPAGRLAHGGEGLGQQVVDLLPSGEPVLQLARTRTQLLVGQLVDRRARGVDLANQAGELLEVAAFTEPEEFLEHHDGNLSLQRSSDGSV